ncbi:hypothetical protein CC1G_01007 [Coprinopsis cinerea okayama7|uniref:Uncharacterized protein n=1 Tax=Coprinopsis cinerea (strain Okayama-7 / 130 / ATCC MYA-4618 / FGSC 9003) TaxID=240176 RepID=A8NE65_COPC7|nr:hypothetical protein CC1G_01007 [Coprinopsis cinerea okayama7\|eukprot:XP_001832945.2 hypothetical protein CC1G_01007 [Coprinopsis cinerea okayama7\
MAPQLENGWTSFTTALLSPDAKRRGIMFQLPNPPPRKPLVLPALEEFICSQPGTLACRNFRPPDVSVTQPSRNERSLISKIRSCISQKKRAKHNNEDRVEEAVSSIKPSKGKKQLASRVGTVIKNVLRWLAGPTPELK